MKNPLFVFGTLMLLSGLLTACGRDGFAPAPAAARTVEIGLLLRKQFTNDISKSRHYRHVHAVLADGTVISFNNSIENYPLWKGLIFATPGTVHTPTVLRRVRQYYMDAATARDCTYHGKPHQKMVTDWVKFKVTPEQAAALAAEWQQLAAQPPRFRLSGKNCSTRAYECLERAGILPGGIPGIDRPENMMEPVKRYYPDYTLERGYFGVDAHNQPYIEPLYLPGVTRPQ